MSKQTEKKADEIKFVVGTDVSSQTIAIISNAFAEPTLWYGNFSSMQKSKSIMGSSSWFDCDQPTTMEKKFAMVFVSKQFIETYSRWKKWTDFENDDKKPPN